MGLKSDIYDAFVKNLGEDNVNATFDGQMKVDELAEDLSKAIQTFLLAQDFKVDKLSAPVVQTSVNGVLTTPIPSTPAAVPPGGLVNLLGQGPFVIETSADVDVNFPGASMGAQDASNNSLVKLRVVKKSSK